MKKSIDLSLRAKLFVIASETKQSRLLRALCALAMTMFVIVIFGTFASAQEAEQSDDEAAVEDLKTDKQCVSEMQSAIMEEQIAFGIFINEHFRSKKPTSELITTAIERYRLYRANVKARFEIEKKNLAAKRTKDTSAVGAQPFAALSFCQQLILDSDQIVRYMLKQHISENAKAKRATRIVDRYKAINAKLEKLSFQIAQTGGYFGALSQKLPCYATSCVR